MIRFIPSLNFEGESVRDDEGNYVVTVTVQPLDIIQKSVGRSAACCGAVQQSVYPGTN